MKNQTIRGTASSWSLHSLTVGQGISKAASTWSKQGKENT